MGTITAIKPQRRPGRYNIMVDDIFTIAVSEKVLVDLDLTIGSEFDENRLAEAAGAEDKSKALSASLRLLESRMRSKKEIKDRLKQHGYAISTIGSVTEKLTEYGLVDDAEFAAAWVDSRSRSQPSGVRKLKSELAQKGVARETIEEALSVVTEDQELVLARKALSKQSRALPDDPIERRTEYGRRAGYLARRGFGWNIVKEALQEQFGRTLDDE
jgi:regulatory protein